MARRNSARAVRRGRKRWILSAALLVAAVLAALYARPAARYLDTGTAYAARVACSCHYVAGRELSDCAKDRLAGMELVRLSADDATQSVTASVPLLASDRAAYREGYGCVLDPYPR
jgi:hypothetical protein